MSRFAFNATCTALMAAVMGALGYFMDHMSTDFDAGLFVGGMGITALLWLCHRMGARIF